MAQTKETDINKFLWPYYDSGLLLKILDFYLKEKTYEKTKVLEQRLKVLSGTKMDSALRSTFKEVHGNTNFPSFYDEQLDKMKENKASMEDILADLLKALREDETVKMLNGEKELNMNQIVKGIEIDTKQLDTLFNYAKLLYDCGEYEESMRLLYFFENASNNKENILSSLWGQLSGHIALNQKTKCFHDFIRLKDTIDSLGANAEQPKARTWLLHWSLFVFFIDEENASTFYEFALESGYCIMIETVCVHLLRYVIVSLLLARNKSILKLILPIVYKIGNGYNDGFIELIKVLGKTLAFDELPEIIGKIKKECEGDYFLKGYTDKIVEEARELTVRSYSKIYSIIGIDNLTRTSGFPTDKAIEIALHEIKERRMEGSLSSDRKTINVTLQETNVNKRIAEKGRELEERTKKFIEVFKSK